MGNITLNMLDSWQVATFLENERLSRLDDYLDDREPREDPGHAVEFMDWEDE